VRVALRIAWLSINRECATGIGEVLLAALPVTGLEVRRRALEQRHRLQGDAALLGRQARRASMPATTPAASRSLLLLWLIHRCMPSGLRLRSSSPAPRTLPPPPVAPQVDAVSLVELHPLLFQEVPLQPCGRAGLRALADPPLGVDDAMPGESRLAG